MPAPSADQAAPFHFAIARAETPPAVVKLPPAYRSLPSATIE